MKSVADYLHQKAAANRVPLSGNFELSPVCNFACKMCYVRKTPEQIAAERKKLLDWQEWLHLAEQCHKEGMLYLLLTGGEPFLYPHFKELYLALHQMGLLLSINTNGTLIDDATLAWLKTSAPARLNITLYGASAASYEKVCGNPKGYERAKSAILRCKEVGIPVVINASMIPENAGDLEAIIAFGKEQRINTRVAAYMFPPVKREGEPEDSRFTPEESAEITMRRFRLQANPDEYLSSLRRQIKSVQEAETEESNWGTREEYMRCRAGRSSFWVSWDGTMTACGMTAFPVQMNPFQTPFRDCWHKLNEKVCGTTVLQECAHCERREICKPCVAMLNAESGDPNRKAPYLCRMSECILEQMRQELQEEVQ